MWLAGPAEWIASNVALSAGGEMKRLATLQARGVLDSRQAIQHELDAHRREVAEALYDRLRNTEAEARFNDLLKQEADISRARGFDTTARKLDAGYLEEAFSAGSAPRASSKDVESSRAVSRALGISPRGILAFVGFMLSPRFCNIKAYQDGYSDDAGSLKVNRCYASTVDFDYWIGDCDHARSRARDQIILMQKLSELTGGYMKPLVGYNPWTDIEDDDASLDLVKEAISERGFVGVKLYPPIGYFPFGNATLPQYPKDAPHPHPGMIDEKLGHLYRFCIEQDVPVMCHGGESMGRLPSHDKLGGPAGWREFFRQPAHADARINLGHFGGADNLAKGSSGWQSGFVDIMKQPAAGYLFGDLGHWDQVARGDGETIESLVRLLRTPLRDGEVVSDRLMFGTDWLMLSQTGAWASYATSFQEVLAGTLDQEELNKLFYANADRLFSRG